MLKYGCMLLWKTILKFLIHWFKKYNNQAESVWGMCPAKEILRSYLLIIDTVHIGLVYMA